MVCVQLQAPAKGRYFSEWIVARKSECPTNKVAYKFDFAKEEQHMPSHIKLGVVLISAHCGDGKIHRGPGPEALRRTPAKDGAPGTHVPTSIFHANEGYISSKQKLYSIFCSVI